MFGNTHILNFWIWLSLSWSRNFYIKLLGARRSRCGYFKYVSSKHFLLISLEEHLFIEGGATEMSLLGEEFAVHRMTDGGMVLEICMWLLCTSHGCKLLYHVLCIICEFENRCIVSKVVKVPWFNYRYHWKDTEIIISSEIFICALSFSTS